MLNMKGGGRRTLGLCLTRVGKQRRHGRRWKRWISSAVGSRGSVTSGSKREPNGGKTATAGSETSEPSSGRSRKPGPSYAGCLSCGDKGHFVKDCKQQSQAAAP
ncbi:unnamed protein product [Sphacelaria rigidula]